MSVTNSHPCGVLTIDKQISLTWYDGLALSPHYSQVLFYYSCLMIFIQMKQICCALRPNMAKRSVFRLLARHSYRHATKFICQLALIIEIYQSHTHRHSFLFSKISSTSIWQIQTPYRFTSDVWDGFGIGLLEYICFYS